MIYISPFSNFW